MQIARWSWVMLMIATACDAPSPAQDGAPVSVDGSAPDSGMAGSDGGDACTTAGCDDGLYCNGAEACTSGACAAGTPPCSSAMCDEEADTCLCGPGMTDADGDGHDSIDCGGDDCDDASASRFPGNTEVCDDGGVDEDCNPATFGARDVDGDGFHSIACCNGSTCGDDCDDIRAEVHPTEAETCDMLDNDCDAAVDEGALITFYRDADGDGRGVDGDTMSACGPPVGYVALSGDCDDTNPSRNPGAPEACDSVDNDCDSAIDEMVVSILYRDEDGDGFGTPGTTRPGCSAGDGWVVTGTDCDDTFPARNPGAVETCDMLDNDCDVAVDEHVQATFYRDADGDDFGLIGMTAPGCPGMPPEGYADRPGDCDDTTGARNPGLAEICDGLDNNCDLVVDEGLRNTYYRDQDGDRYGVAGMTTLACSRPAGYADDPGDCDDTTGSRNPGLAEVCDGLDNNCDLVVDEGVRNTYYRDADGDMHGDMGVTMLACSVPSGYVMSNDDCDDTRAFVYFGAPEVCDAIDGDCDGAIDDGVILTFYRDVDGDGYGVATMTTTGCAPPSGYAPLAGDCNDAIPSVRPGATELCDGYDTDCAGGLSYPGEDNDGDGHGDSALCVGAAAADDCNDASAAIRPGVAEIPGDGVDQNCDGTELCYADADNDGYRPDATSTVVSANLSCFESMEATATDPLGDCCDSDVRARPGSTGDSTPRGCGGGYDFNCDGAMTLGVANLTNGGFCPSGSGSSCAGAATRTPGWVGSVPGCGVSGTFDAGCFLRTFCAPGCATICGYSTPGPQTQACH